MQVTSLETLKQMKKTDIVELSNFEDKEATPFAAELKKPNMMQLIASGKIPNSLMQVAMDMFNGKSGEVAQKATTNSKDLTDMVEMMLFLAEVCLVSPSLQDLKDNDITLTEQQLMEILTYSQGGVKALENFRNQ